MPQLHLFYPENDLALARGIANYTAPPAAVSLRRSGYLLPLWYAAGSDDRVICEGADERWLARVQRTFGIHADVWNHSTGGFEPAPWGWSLASRRFFSNLGFDAVALPPDSALERIRALSHRRTAAIVHSRLTEALPGLKLTPAAEEITDIAAAEAFLDRCPDAIFKLPWSSSGRGLVPVDPSIRKRKLPEIKGMIARQGSVMAEPRLARRSDFALLYDMADGHAAFRGYSLFTTESSGNYTGNIIMPQDEIARRLISESSPALTLLPEVLGHVLESVLGTGYNGPVGADMLTVAGSDAVALTEINLRMTMGRAVLESGRYIHPDFRGIFRILPSAAAPAENAEVRDGRLYAGTLHLTPPGNDFTFIIENQNSAII